MKLFGKIALVIAVLAIVAVLLLVMLVDANKFKPRIESMAKERGLLLNIGGDLGWSFWPSIGVAVKDVSVGATITPNQPIAQINQASLLLDLLPLLAGKFQVDHIIVDGASVDLKIDNQGRGNWEDLMQTNRSSKTEQTSPSNGTLNLKIDQISVTNMSVDYADDASGQKFRATDINLAMAGVNMQSEPFDADLSWRLELAGADAKNLAIQGVLTNRITLNKNFQTINLDDGKIQLTINDQSDAEINLQYSLVVTELQKQANYQGQLRLAEIDLKKLLSAFGSETNTADANALSEFSFSSNIIGSTNHINLNNLQLQLDQTQFQGELQLKDFKTNAVKLELRGDEINVDNYLSSENNVVTAAPAVPANDNPLPMETLRKLNLNAKISFEKIIFNKLSLAEIKLKFLAKNGMLEHNLSAKAYEGNVKLKTQLDARGQQAQVQFDGGIDGLALKPLLNDLEINNKLTLSGLIQLRALGSTEGASVNDLLKFMRSNANFSGAQVRLEPINLEEQFCRLVDLVTQSAAAQKNWQPYTDMQELSGSVKWRDEIITLDTFKANVAKLQLGSIGKINLAADEYDLVLPFKLAKTTDTNNPSGSGDMTTSSEGCALQNAFWVDRNISLLRCKGTFSELSPVDDCRPDKSALLELTKDFAAYKLREKHGEKIDAAEQKLKDKRQELLDKANQKLGGEGEVRRPKDILNNLLKKKLGTQESSAAASVTSSTDLPPSASSVPVIE